MMDEQTWIRREGEAGLVSVLIPAYNAQETVAATLASVWKQKYRPVEVVLIDDGSTDRTDAVIQEWIRSLPEQKEFVVRYLRQSNQGLLACRNRGTLEAKGEYLQYLDADDLLHPAKLDLSVAALIADERCDVVVVRTGLFRQDQDVFDKLNRPPALLPWSDSEVSVPLIARAFWYTPGPLFRRRIIDKAGPFSSAVHPVAEEIEFHARIKCVTRNIHYLPEQMDFHRIGLAGQLTRNLDQLYRGKVDAIQRLEQIMERHNISDMREWRLLVRLALSTVYATAACSRDIKLYVTAFHLAKRLAGENWRTISVIMHFFPATVWAKICSGIYKIRTSHRSRIIGA